MKTFTIERNEFLTTDITAFAHSDYTGGTGRWRKEGTVEHLICKLKNDIAPRSIAELKPQLAYLMDILVHDLPLISAAAGNKNLTMCIVPRAKVSYEPEQLLFRESVAATAQKTPGFIDGTDFIQRIEDTRTTHRNKRGYGGIGPMPYPGITEDTCNISDQVAGKDILLIDDLYTKTINIDEDAIQALLNHGAKSVIFYAVGYAVLRRPQITVKA